MATLAIQELVRNGGTEELTLEGAAASDVLPNSGDGAGRRMLIIVSMDAAARTVEIAPAGGGLEIGDGSLLLVEPQQLTLGNDQPSLGMTGPLNPTYFGTAPVVTPSVATDISYAWVEYPD